MFKYFIFCSLLMPVAFCFASPGVDENVIAIKKQSLTWNTAFSTGDVRSLLNILSTDVQFASAGGKWQSREGANRFFEQLFKRRPDIVWINTPHEIKVNHNWHVAYETGDWRENWTEPDGQAIIQGKYFAMWQQVQGFWLLQSIIFTPLSCSGSNYCNTN